MARHRSVVLLWWLSIIILVSDVQESQGFLAGLGVMGPLWCRARCPDTPEYVCGTNKKTYPSSCAAKCLKVGLKHLGKCGSVPFDCPGVYDLVCGSDGKTYLNSCFAAHQFAKVKSNGECPKKGK